MQEVIQIGNLWGYDTKFKNKTTGRVYDKEGVSPTLNTMTGGWKQPMIIDNGSIRKLTPKSCWRLMDFSDEDFHKAESVNSNTRLYAQAGNSIVRNVLVAIFGQMLPGKEDEYKKGA